MLLVALGQVTSCPKKKDRGKVRTPPTHNSPAQASVRGQVVQGLGLLPEIWVCWLSKEKGKGNSILKPSKSQIQRGNNSEAIFPITIITFENYDTTSAEKVMRFLC